MSSSPLSNQPEWADAPPIFSCTLYAEAANVTRVTPSGDLDLFTAPQLAEAVAEACDGRRLVILDLSQVTFIDSSGLHAIVTAQARLAEADCRLVLVPGGRQVQRIFELTGVDHLFEFVGARDAHDVASDRFG